MRSCSLCGGQKTIPSVSKFGKEFKRRCGRCKGTGLFSKQAEIKKLRAAQLIVEQGPGMPELTNATIALSDAIRILEAE